MDREALSRTIVDASETEACAAITAFRGCVTSYTPMRRSPLAAALQRGSPCILRALAQRPENRFFLLQAARDGMVTSFLQQWPAPVCLDVSEYGCGKTALHIAAEMGTMACVVSLLDCGADTSVRDVYGVCPATAAMYCDHDAACTVLARHSEWVYGGRRDWVKACVAVSQGAKVVVARPFAIDRTAAVAWILSMLGATANGTSAVLGVVLDDAAGRVAATHDSYHLVGEYGLVIGLFLGTSW